MTTDRPTSRVLYQSYTDPSIHQAYLGRLDAYLQRITPRHIEVEVRGIHPADTQLGRLSELRCGIQGLADIVRAEQEGFDAVVVGHFQDSLLYETRTAVDIPVIGLGEASLHQACMQGGRIGLVGIDPVYVPWHREQIRRYGLESRVVDVRTMQMTPDEAEAAFTDERAYERIRENFLGLAKQMVIESEVDVVMSSGGLFALLGADDDSLKVAGATILNPVLLAVKQAEVALSLVKESSPIVSRGSTFTKASEQSIAEFMAIAPPSLKQHAQKDDRSTQMQYTAVATADGNGRNGRVSSPDQLIDLQLGIPAELGGAGGNVSNPEQLFAAGYAGCFMSALATVARQNKVKLTDPSVTAEVTIAASDDGFNLSVKLLADLPGVDAEVAEGILQGAHQKCPYSRAVRGNITVTIEQV